jgi:Ribonuclease G/E
MLKWPWLEGAALFLHERGNVPLNVCAYSVAERRESLCEYLRRHCPEDTAGWFAALLERAGVVEINRPRPTTVNLAEQFQANCQPLNGTRSMHSVGRVAADLVPKYVMTPFV